MIHRTARRCAVLGSPIGHSLSPALHRAAYAEVGLDWTYDACEVREEDLARFLDSLDQRWRGLSLTMPLKRSVVPLVDELSERAAQAQAANTLIMEAGRRVGHNTDIPGAARAIAAKVPAPVGRAVILGGGATATSTLLALADLGCSAVTLVVRDAARAAEAVAAAGRHPDPPDVDVSGFDATPVDADLLVSTIPATAQGALAVPWAEHVPAIFDVIYDPWPTPLAMLATARGMTLVSGLELLVNQAADQFTLMTGIVEAPVQAMREAGERVLAQRRPQNRAGA